MVLGRLHLLPIVIFLWFPGTFVITYVTAVNLGDVLPIFPYISDTGTFSPESCVFGQMLNTGAVLMALAVYIRYREVKETDRMAGNVDNVENLNNKSLWLGFVAAFGVSVVGNFQETNVFSVHVLGAFLAFGLGTVYICMQTVVAFRLQQNSEQKRVNLIRAILCTVCVIGFTICSLTAAVSMLQFKGQDVTKWSKEDGGYDSHLASTITEWIVAICQMAFLLTYSEGFKRVAFEEPAIHIDGRRSSTKIFPQTVHHVDNDRY